MKTLHPAVHAGRLVLTCFCWLYFMEFVWHLGKGGSAEVAHHLNHGRGRGGGDLWPLISLYAIPDNTYPRLVKAFASGSTHHRLWPLQHAISVDYSLPGKRLLTPFSSFRLTEVMHLGLGCFAPSSV